MSRVETGKSHRREEGVGQGDNLLLPDPKLYGNERLGTRRLREDLTLDSRISLLQRGVLPQRHRLVWRDGLQTPTYSDPTEYPETRDPQETGSVKGPTTLAVQKMEVSLKETKHPPRNQSGSVLRLEDSGMDPIVPPVRTEWSDWSDRSNLVVSSPVLVTTVGPRTDSGDRGNRPPCRLVSTGLGRRGREGVTLPPDRFGTETEGRRDGESRGYHSERKGSWTGKDGKPSWSSTRTQETTEKFGSMTRASLTYDSPPGKGPRTQDLGSR